MQDEAFGDLELKSSNSHNMTTDMGGEATAATERKQTNLQKINANVPKKKNMGRFTMNKLLGNDTSNFSKNNAASTHLTNNVVVE